MALTDAYGDVVERYEYGDFGKPKFYDAAGTPLTGSLVGNPCLFTGQRYDVETGFCWYKSRYLEPRTGRFTSRDPIGLWGDPLNLGNPYTFTGNNPWSWLDPYGLCTDTDGEKEKSWWERLNTPSEGNDARSMFPLYDVEMRDWEGITPYEDPDYVAQNLGNARNDDPHWRASTGNLNEVMQQGKYSGMRDGAIGGVGYGVGKAAGSMGDDFVDLASPKRRRHVLDGDETGGGHRPGRGIPGKSEFPVGWSDDKIMDAISDVATDPNSIRRTGSGGRTIVEGVYDGLRIRVVLGPDGEIITGYPIG